MRPEKDGPLRKELRAVLKGEAKPRIRVVKTTYGRKQQRRHLLDRWRAEWEARKESQA